MKKIFSNSSAFAALKTDGHVVSWGNKSNGGDSSSASNQLAAGVSKIFSTSSALAALKTDGSIVTWGSKGNGGDNESVSGQIGSDVVSLLDPFHQDQLIYSETQTTQVGITIDYSDPVFITTSSSTAIEENSEVGQVVFFGSATDISPIMYGITANNEDGNSLSINSGTGEVTLAIRPDFETKSA